MIAGRIIPAMVTTTSLITGVVMFEIAKIICIPREKWNLQVFRNSFNNLAVAFTAFSDPIAPATQTYGPPANPKAKSWTLWDRFEIDMGRDITLQEFMDFSVGIPAVRYRFRL
jgi:ubiquitin-activating enzyme E1